VLSCGERPFETGDRRRLSPHTFGNLGLRESGFVPRFQEQIQERAFFSLNALDFLTDTGAVHELGYKLIMG
jgi:hypothetical protein